MYIVSWYVPKTRNLSAVYNLQAAILIDFNSFRTINQYFFFAGWEFQCQITLLSFICTYKHIFEVDYMQKNNGALKFDNIIFLG